MKNVATFKTYESLSNEQLEVEGFPVSTKQTLSTSPFPRKHVLSVFVDLQDAKQAAYALYQAGFDERTIYVLQNRDFVEAITQDRSPFDIFTSTNYDMYLREANRGRFFLAVRPTNYSQLNQIRNLLMPHHAYLATYSDAWTLTELLP